MKNNDIVRYRERERERERERVQLLRYGADLGCSKRGEITTELQGGKCRIDANVIFSTGES
jgi:hypothetical protein